MNFQPSERSQHYLKQLCEFMRQHVFPVEQEVMAFHHQHNRHGDWQRWELNPKVEALKKQARDAGLWNLFLPDAELGQGLSTLEYAPLAEQMGRSVIASEIFNCNAPDTGNMEVLYHFGSAAQQQQWLTPLLQGDIRSVFFMTEPQVASSDATNMQASITDDGDELVLNGRKWWSTGLGHPKAKVGIFMGLSDPDANKHERHAMVLVELDRPGVSIQRMLTAYGDYDAPYGHGEVVFDQVRVPKHNLIVGMGKGFAIAQGRLGPGRIHHCMRAIGAAERALELGIKRASARRAFGHTLTELGANKTRIAEIRMAIDQARLLTLNAAWKIDVQGVKQAMTEISAIKVIAPRVMEQAVDFAIQLHGGEGMSDDTPLAGMMAMARALRLADGPDEVHQAMVARLELAKYKEKTR
ncbi:acyl-CoA dehydrogenase family protein [Lacimicrobium sp. SS2-24]|uniref:acyl-CoA dehydrogenase family protein n=1 Tax=Lacimicrobium sp. SS2-24 TaxID=2005569 RepID=UPI000B4B9274|nr:acyl-CoA dehydrogenase family protein [Lacimicrobium sp. SS2-24]